jgi:endo-1,4-beta-xylanase
MLDEAEKKLDRAISANRTAKAALTVYEGRNPIPFREASVEQTRHKFQFGANWGKGFVQFANGEAEGKARELAEARNERFLALFNQATLPFYWAFFEPERGRPQTERLMNVARWYKDRGVRVKGHPLCWHTRTADWLLAMTEREILKAQVERIRRDVAAFAGVIDAWDVINEAVIMPVFDKYENGITRLCKELGRIKLIRTVFEVARETDPNATLLINDFDVSSAYDILVEGCLEAGVKIDVIGIQSHMHQGYWGMEKTHRVLEHFERFNLPIHFTENTILSGKLMPPEIRDLNDYQPKEWPSTPEGEERQAREVVLHYKSLFAHPAVQSVTWWDLSDGGWLGAPAGLLRQDQSPKPAYDELLKLVKGEWWFKPTKMRTNKDGQLDFTGFLGDYKLTLEGKIASFSVLEKGENAISVHF